MMNQFQMSNFKCQMNVKVQKDILKSVTLNLYLEQG